MARASTRTLIPLDTFFKVIGIHPLHANQVHIAGIPACGNTILQYSWQSAGRVSREDIAVALRAAEDRIGAELGFDIIPCWQTSELVPTGVGGWDSVVKLGRGYVIGGGVEALSLIEEDAPITFDTRFARGTSSTTPPTTTEFLGFEELAIVEVVTSVLSSDEIAIFYPASSGFSSGGDYAWQIQPLSVAIGVPSAGRATITFRREQLVHPALLEEFAAEAVDGLNDDAFVGSVDVYRHYNNPATQVEFRYRVGCCCAEGCAQCVYSTQTGCLVPIRSRLGQVQLASSTWDGNAHVSDWPDLSVCGNSPEGASINYKAGYTGPDTSELIRVTCNYALSLLGQSLCDCSGIENKFDFYTTDLVSGVSSTGGSDSKQRVYREPSPLGSTRAAFEAWEYIKNRALGRKGIMV